MNYLSHNLKNTDAEDVTDMLALIERSFQVKFDKKELLAINSIHELGDLIRAKSLEDAQHSCTSQQAFYKFRKAYRQTNPTNRDVYPSQSLETLWPRKLRKQAIKAIERNLGFALPLLEPPTWLSIGLLIALLISIASLFFYPLFGTMGLLLVITGFTLAQRYANKLTFNTVKELIDYITCYNYLQVRRRPNINTQEIDRILVHLFSEELGYDKAQFNALSTFD